MRRQKQVTLHVRPAVVVKTDAGDVFHLWPDPAVGIGCELMRCGGTAIETTAVQTSWGKRFVTAVPDGRVRLDFANGEHFFLTKQAAVSLGRKICGAVSARDAKLVTASRDATNVPTVKTGATEHRGDLVPN